jgi:CheY-like chemotaxis protein
MSLILLVDDLPELLDLYTDILEMLGHRVLAAYDGLEALKLAHERKPDLVVTDWRLPRMDGCELCLKLRADDELHDVPVLLQSADADPHAPGVNTFLPKPCDLARFEGAVQALLPRGGAEWHHCDMAP